MARPIVTLTTDFGESSPYVACMKGVLHRLNPELTVVDVTHRVPPQDVRYGAFALWQIVPFFPPGTIHVAVVDPGVGTSREILYAEMAEQRFLAPDNGLLSWVAREHALTHLRSVTESRFWRDPVSATFHGRDILAPVAAHLSLGLAPEQLGPLREVMCTLPWPQPRRGSRDLDGEVLVADSFGNLITNITRDDLEGVPGQAVQVAVDAHETTGIYRTYGDVEPGTLVALVGSSGLLEVAITGDSAAEMLGVGAGAPVRLRW